MCCILAFFLTQRSKSKQSLPGNAAAKKTEPKPFRIIEANLNSLKGKKEELNSLIETERPDCLVLVETKLDDTFNTAEFFNLNTWNVVIKEDRNKFGGGIIIATLRKHVVTPVKIVYENENHNHSLFSSDGSPYTGLKYTHLTN